MAPHTSDWVAIACIGLIGAAIIAALSSGERGFGLAFVYALTGLVTVAASFIGTVILLAPAKDRDDTRLLMAGLIGFFVTTPLALTAIFYFLDKALPW